MYCCYCWAINYKNNKHADGRIPRLILAHIQLISRQICTAAQNVSSATTATRLRSQLKIKWKKKTRIGCK